MKRLWLVLAIAAVLGAICLGARVTVDTLLLNSDAAVQASLQAQSKDNLQAAVQYTEQARDYWQRRTAVLSLLFSKDLLVEMDAALQELAVAVQWGDSYEVALAHAQYRTVRDAMHAVMHESL